MFLKRASSPYVFACSLPFAVACGVLSLSGCSSSSKIAPEATPDDAGVGDTGSPSLSFTVVEAESTKTPIAGALAYAQYKDGKDEHARADASGKVTFTSTSLAGGLAAVSVGTATRTIHTFVEPDVSALASKPFSLELLVVPQTFKLSGPLTPTTPGDSILMQASISPAIGNFQADKVSAPAAYSLQLPPNLLFTVYGSEYLQTQTQFSRGFDSTITKWFHVDHPGLTSDTTFALDLTALPSDKPMTANGTLEIPGGAVGPLGGASTAFVLVLGNNGQSNDGVPNIGFTTSIKIASDALSFVYTLEYVPYPNLTPYTYAQITQVDGSFSYIDVAGFPTAGQKLTGLAIPVALSGPLAEGSAIDATAASAGQSVLLETNTSGVSPFGHADLWDVALPPGKVSKIPVLAPELKALLPAGTSLTALVQVTSPSLAGTFTVSRVVAITP